MIEKINHLRKNLPNVILRYLVNIWSLVALAIYIYEFFNGNSHSKVTTHLTITYIGILSIYVGSKEFSRWHNKHRSTQYGEVYVVLWTIMMVSFVVLSMLKENLEISHDLAAAYIAIISIFAITRESRRLYSDKRR